MKVRTGFVSNSSSSSFVVAFPHKPKDLGDMISMMFPGATESAYVTDMNLDDTMSISDVAEKVLKDIKDNDIKTDRVVSEFSNIGFDLPDQYEVIDDNNPDNLNSYLLTKEKDELVRSKKESDAAWQELWKDEKDKQKKARANKLSDEHYELYNELVDKCAKMKAKDFLSANKKKFVAVFEYSDNKGDGCLEHGDIFKNLNHVTISKH